MTKTFCGSCSAQKVFPFSEAANRYACVDALKGWAMIKILPFSDGWWFYLGLLFLRPGLLSHTPNSPSVSHQARDASPCEAAARSSVPEELKLLSRVLRSRRHRRGGGCCGLRVGPTNSCSA